MKAVKLILVRHGKDDDRFRGGWSNLDLLPEGREQAHKLARFLKENNAGYPITEVISSDLPRAMTTASTIAKELCLTVRKESRLREINNGDLAGMRNDVALEKYPGLFFSTLRMDEAYPNGESPNAFYGRIRNWFESFSASFGKSDGNILVVTHAGVINVIYHLVNHRSWSNRTKPYKASNCSIHVLNMDTMTFETENKVDFLSI